MFVRYTEPVSGCCICREALSLMRSSGDLAIPRIVQGSRTLPSRKQVRGTGDLGIRTLFACGVLRRYSLTLSEWSGVCQKMRVVRRGRGSNRRGLFSPDTLVALLTSVVQSTLLYMTLMALESIYEYENLAFALRCLTTLMCQKHTCVLQDLFLGIKWSMLGPSHTISK